VDHATDADGDCKCGWSFCRDVVVSLCHVFAFLVSELMRSACRPRHRRVGRELSQCENMSHHACRRRTDSWLVFRD
jgi:hypothetical protein